MPMGTCHGFSQNTRSSPWCQAVLDYSCGDLLLDGGTGRDIQKQREDDFGVSYVSIVSSKKSVVCFYIVFVCTYLVGGFFPTNHLESKTLGVYNIFI